MACWLVSLYSLFISTPLFIWCVIEWISLLDFGFNSWIISIIPSINMKWTLSLGLIGLFVYLLFQPNKGCCCAFLHSFLKFAVSATLTTLSINYLILLLFMGTHPAFLLLYIIFQGFLATRAVESFGYCIYLMYLNDQHKTKKKFSRPPEI